MIARVGQTITNSQSGINFTNVTVEDITMMFTTLAFLGVFFVLVFLACTSLVLYYKQLSEGMEDAGPLPHPALDRPV